MKNQRLVCAVALAFCTLASAEAQVLNRLKQRVGNNAENKAGQKIDELFSGKDKNAPPGGQAGQGTPGSGGMNGGMGGNNPANTSGGGLISTPPDVPQNLTEAEAAYKRNSYGEARYAVQQAMLGVELEIGNKILKSLPESISGLPKEADRDQVASNGWGWAGLIIKREYQKGDKQLTINVANNSAWMAGVNAYLASGGYAQQTGGQQNWKQTKVKGYRAVIEYSEGSGYKLSIPLGQSSLVLCEGLNFASEQEMMTAANALDLDGIKNMLGEQ
ncbi:MAG: hypothetical protein MUC38_15570 [Cyclobacteriaceae bacterium]|nr:hypothetical protein [Cyclobacteriaceae bacterium]